MPILSRHRHQFALVAAHDNNQISRSSLAGQFGVAFAVEFAGQFAGQFSVEFAVEFSGQSVSEFGE